MPTKFRDFDFPVNFNVTGVTGPGNGNLINGPDFTYQGSLAMTKITGRHTVGFGYDYTKLRTIHDSVFLNFGFNNVATGDPQNLSSTGHPFASFLLGLVSSGDTGRIAGEADLDIDQQLHHLWVQDDFKVTNKLTLNLGLRYEYNQWPHHRRGRMGGFDMLLGRFYWTSRNPITGEPANVPETIAEPKRKNFAPRIGLAYRLGPRTVIRSAYGIFYNSNLGWEWSTGRGNWPYSISDNVTHRPRFGHAPFGFGTLVVHTALNPLAVTSAVTAMVHQLDAELPVSEVGTMQRWVDESLLRTKFQTGLLAVFAGLALLLATLGIYGVMSYGVAQRRDEIGVRIALGAQRGQVAWMILSRALVLTLTGLALGLAGAAALGRYLETLLFEIKPADAVTLGSVTAVLLAVALLAALFPTRRATKVDPMIVLHYD